MCVCVRERECVCVCDLVGSANQDMSVHIAARGVKQRGSECEKRDTFVHCEAHSGSAGSAAALEGIGGAAGR